MLDSCWMYREHHLCHVQESMSPVNIGLYQGIACEKGVVYKGILVAHLSVMSDDGSSYYLIIEINAEVFILWRHGEQELGNVVRV